ncbi:hypothetical protein [Cupriavidus necator]
MCWTAESCRWKVSGCGFRYAGTGRLDLEAYLVQEDPIAALGQLVRLVKRASGEPQFARGFLEHAPAAVPQCTQSRAAGPSVVPARPSQYEAKGV